MPVPGGNGAQYSAELLEKARADSDTVLKELDLRYEITREFAPYIGVQWLQQFGETADISRREGGRAESITVVFGVRLWF